MRRQSAPPASEGQSVERSGDSAAHLRSRALKEALADLPSDQREVLVLRHVVGLSPREIAERLGKHEAAIHGLHHRGRGALKAKLHELDRTPVASG
jgi:RNA polymerase sigma-70 factor (ECF subfamily)